MVFLLDKKYFITKEDDKEYLKLLFIDMKDLEIIIVV